MNAMQNGTTARSLEVGEQRDVRAGVLTLFGHCSSQTVNLGGFESLVMLEDEVLAVIDDAAATKRP